MYIRYYVKIPISAPKKNEKKEIKSIYKDMIRGGKFIFPEASKILKYYISDHTDDLYINSEYFYKSEYIKKILKENENKEIIGPVYSKINKIMLTAKLRPYTRTA